MSAQQKFMDPKNESMLDKLVYQDFQRRLGSPLNEKQKARLLRTVHHYMEEVAEKGGDMSLQSMNKEVLTLVVPDFNAYLNRQNISSKSDVESRMKEDIGSRFASLQNERTDDSVKALMPPTPDFRIPLDDETASPLSLFEQAKKAREAEIMNSSSSAPPPSRRSDEGEGTYLKDLDANVANGNPTIAKAEEVRSKPVLPQDLIIPQDEILSYKENEYNLVVYSADRDWYNNQKENRYNFSVSFNPSNNTQGFKYSPTVNNRFHNIVRIEMVKAIVPVEGIDTLMLNPVQKPNVKNQSLTILSLPGISISIDELESNMFGTDDTLDRAFATLQYDAQWFGNSINNIALSLPNPGFYAMIPKFLKCQRIYNPTPLATLQKMTIQLNRPNGTLVSSTLDTLDIISIFGCVNPPTGYNIGSFFGSIADSSDNSVYYYIRTKTYFSINNFYRGDTIQIKGINTSLIIGNDTAKSDFKNYFENTIGLTILDIGYNNIGYNNIDDTEIEGGVYNNQNYANYLIVQARYTDPTLGPPLDNNIRVNPFGGSTATSIALEQAIKDVNFTGARLINLSKQTQLTFRVITRDMDSTTRIRANNA